MNKSEEAQIKASLVQAKELLKEAASEIKRLQHNNDMQRLRLDTFDKCMQLVNISPSHNTMGLSSPDVERQIALFLNHH